jgi:hypothetical protein
VIPPSIAAIIHHFHEQLRGAVDAEHLSSKLRGEVISAASRAARRALRTRIRRKSTWRDAAYEDYKAGMRGLALYRRHIPNFEKLSRWARLREQDRLSNALQKRVERDRKIKSATATTETAVSPTP